MRSAPFGLVRTESATDDLAYEFARAAAAFTHGHPTGQVASGALALLVHRIVTGADGSLRASVDAMLGRLESDPQAAETRRAVEAACRLAEAGRPSAEAVESLGGGWVAEEALAIAVYCALVHPGPDEVLDALSLAVTHSGDSDSTGSLCGNLLGALHGDSALPAVLAFEVEGRGTILQLADDLVLEVTAGLQLHGEYGPDTRWRQRYPGW